MIDFQLSVSKASLSTALGVRFDNDYYFHPQRRYEIDRQCADYVARELADLGACYTESNLGRRAYLHDNQVLIGGIQPNMILGMLLGARFLPADDRDADISPECWRGRDPDDLPLPEGLVEHELIAAFDQQYRAVRCGGQLEPIPPFFWDSSGRAAIHGPVTSAQKLQGPSIFTQMLTDAERAHHVTEWITEAYIVLIRHFAELAQIELTEIHVGECSACMVSPALFEQFVVPRLSRMGREIGPIRLHSCGRSDHILSICPRITGLATLDVGGETSLALVRETLGRDFPVSIAPLVQDLSARTAVGLLNWADRIAEENQNGPLTIVCHLEPTYNLQLIRQLQTYMQSKFTRC